MVGPEAKLVVSMPAAIGGAGTLVVGAGLVAWAVFTFTVGSMRDDTAATRQRVDSLREYVDSEFRPLRESVSAMRDDVSAIKAQNEILIKYVVPGSQQNEPTKEK